jgi:hypothetical protein
MLCIICGDDIITAAVSSTATTSSTAAVSGTATTSNISCGNLEDPHTICISCFNDYLQNAELLPKLTNMWELYKCIPCACCDYNYPTYKEIKNIDILHSYIDFEFKMRENRISLLEQKLHEPKVVNDYTSKIFLDICDIATTCKKCPYCLVPFFEFTGCMALHCISCGKHFCGFCLQIHNDDGISIIDGETASGRCHKYVKSHTDILSNFAKDRMGITSVYFMREDRWRDHIRDTVMFNLIKEYLFKIKISELYPIMESVFRRLDYMIISSPNLTILRQFLCSNDSATTHKLRLPAIFATIYSAKRNRRIEDAMDILTMGQKVAIGGFVLKKISDKYSGWKHYKIRVPGEAFESISYPISMYEDIHNIIEEWGRLPENGSIWR